ncbi:MAG TPA: helix-turn-helix transcriptional regulator [Aquamicrobium sp.]|nr:helix-turn-helix transcriptional regulator [Aquamicrobium sp.]
MDKVHRPQGLGKDSVFFTHDFGKPDDVQRLQASFASFWGPIKVSARDRSSFYGHLESRAYARLRFNRLNLRSMAFRRFSARDQTVPFLSLGFPQRGKVIVSRGNEEWAIVPDAVYFVRHHEPDITTIPELYESINVQIPLHLLEQRLARIPSFSFLPLTSGSVARVIKHFVWGLREELPHASEEDVRFLSDQLCDLIAGVMGDAREPSGSETMALRAHRERVLKYLEDRAHEHALTPSGIAGEMGISVSYLHRVFAAGGNTVMAELRRIRLMRAQRMLASGAFRGLPVSEIALRCGFKSLPSFSRAFRQAAGVSPVEFRAAHCPAPVDAVELQ